jgi:oxygen-independent coproporphyrinogen-3 oxidase
MYPRALPPALDPTQGLSTQRGFVFQYPPLPALDNVAGDRFFPRSDPTGLYVHIPFCPYHCAFCYYAILRSKNVDTHYDAYLGLLRREMELQSQALGCGYRAFQTVFFGGGTPTQIGARRLVQLIEVLGDLFDLESVTEFTVEADPTTVTDEAVALLASHGVNRISIGVQSFSDEVNALHGRRHTSAEAATACRVTQEAGIENINIDLICGLSGETEITWRHTISQLLALSPAHATIYLLSLRPQTALHRQVGHAIPAPPDESQRIRMYDFAREQLSGRGYRQTTPNCFVRAPRFEQVHQRNAWSSLPLLGLGLSAYSYLDGRVTQNHRQAGPYEADLRAGRTPVEIALTLNAREQMIRYCVLRLKLLHISPADFRTRFGFDLLDVFAREFDWLSNMGLVRVTPTSVELSDKGMLYVDDACRAFYSDEVWSRLSRDLTISHARLRKSLI